MSSSCSLTIIQDGSAEEYCSDFIYSSYSSPCHAECKYCFGPDIDECYECANLTELCMNTTVGAEINNTLTGRCSESQERLVSRIVTMLSNIYSKELQMYHYHHPMMQQVLRTYKSQEQLAILQRHLSILVLATFCMSMLVLEQEEGWHFSFFVSFSSAAAAAAAAVRGEELRERRYLAYVILYCASYRVTYSSTHPVEALSLCLMNQVLTHQHTMKAKFSPSRAWEMLVIVR